MFDLGLNPAAQGTQYRDQWGMVNFRRVQDAQAAYEAMAWKVGGRIGLKTAAGAAASGAQRPAGRGCGASTCDPSCKRPAPAPAPAPQVVPELSGPRKLKLQYRTE